ncbi:MAG: biopolymer transporter ExbD [Rikenellaceae bacterium]
MANKRQIQEINAGSMADIAFLLLIFFLVATTMNTDTGLSRMLPPLPEDENMQESIKIKERNLLLVFVSGSGKIMAGGKTIEITELKDKAKEFIQNPFDDPDLPEKVMKTIEVPGSAEFSFAVSEGVISLQTTRETSYDVYVAVQNELTRAFAEARDELSQRKFQKSFENLSKEMRNVVTKAIPLKISEAEPRLINK